MSSVGALFRKMEAFQKKQEKKKMCLSGRCSSCQHEDERKKCMSKFIVGKKYIGSTDGRIPPEVYTLVYKNQKCITLEDRHGDLHTHNYENYGSLYGFFVEWVEPRSITRWVNIWQKSDGTINIGENQYDSKENAIKYYQEVGGWKILDTIEIKWTEKT